MRHARAAILLAVSGLTGACFKAEADRTPEERREAASAPDSAPQLPPPPVDCRIAGRDFEVIAAYPHDPTAFTQGLFYEDGFLYEGTGRYGQSTLRRVDLETGEVRRQIRLPSQYFGEGVAAVGEQIFQLTWRSGIGFVYSKRDLQARGRFHYGMEGWGLATHGDGLVMSDGSHVLTFLTADASAVVGRVEVHHGAGFVPRLNELESIDGAIFANVWLSPKIVKIDPRNGTVIGRYDLSPLVECAAPSDHEGVLNGIAYDDGEDRTFVTGKLWSRLFEIRFRSGSGS